MQTIEEVQFYSQNNADNVINREVAQAELEWQK